MDETHDPRRPDWSVHADAAQAETLPASTFTDPAWARHEQRTLFQRAWLALSDPLAADVDEPRGLEERVRRRGAYLPLTVAGRPHYLHRGFDGILRLMPNVCTHAWHTLVEGPGRDRKVVCPQHGRVFDDQGRYTHQPGFERMADMPRACDHLAAREVHQYGPLLFAALGDPGESFARIIGPVRESLQHMPWSALERRRSVDETRTLEGNWKLHAWNYMDTLHIPHVHRQPGGLADAVDLDSYVTELHGDAALQWAYARDQEAGFPPSWLPDRFAAPTAPDEPEHRVFALWWFLFPNLAINVYPWGLSINQYLPHPQDPTKTRFHWQTWSWHAQRFQDRERLWHLAGVDDEDVDALAKVARGVASGMAPRGRFAPGVEDGPHWFHRLMWERTRERP